MVDILHGERTKVNFRRGRFREEPEINFIPLIDVLLVVLIFLMASTAYSKFTELKISLPEADAEKQVQRPKEINVGVDATSRFALNKQCLRLLRSPLAGTGSTRCGQRRRQASGHHQCRYPRPNIRMWCTSWRRRASRSTPILRSATVGPVNSVAAGHRNANASSKK